MLQKFKSLIVNCLPSLLKVFGDNWIKLLFQIFTRSLIRRPYLPIRDSLDPFHIPHLWNAKLTGSQLFKNIYIMLYVVINLLIWFWERCIEIYFRTCAGSPQAFRFTSYFPVLICVNITQDLGKTWPYFKIYSKNIWSKKYEEIWKIWRRWNLYDKN